MGAPSPDSSRPNVLDRAISFFSPQVAVRRMAARQILQEFSVTVQRGGSGGRAKNASSETYGKNRSRLDEMWDARNLAEYDWIGGTLARIVNYVIGELECKSATGDPEVDAAYDQYFKDWAGEEDDDDGLTRCDTTGRQTFLKQLQMSLLAMFVDGDHGLLFTLGDDPSTPETEKDLQIQQIEADRIGNPLEVQLQEGYVAGVRFDPAIGRPTSYTITDRTLHGMYTNPREIEPVNFIHLWDPDRSDQYRGRSYLKRILPHARDIREWVEAEKIAGKTQSQWAAAFISKNPNSRNGAANWDNKTADGTPTMDAVWGKILRMGEGESMSMLSPSARPSGAFLSFIQTIIRLIAVSLDLPFGFVWDLASLGGVTARIELQAAQRKVNHWQRLLVKVIRRTRRLVLARGIALQKIPPHPLYRKCDYHFGAWIVTDAGYETQNDLSLIQAGLMSPEEATLKRSKVPMDILRARASLVKAAQQLAIENGLPIEAFAGQLFPDITQQLAAIQTPPPPPPEPGSIEAVGDAGAKTIIEILSKAGDGTMDRAAAVNTLVTVYHLPPEQAEAIVPKTVKPEPSSDKAPWEES